MGSENRPVSGNGKWFLLSLCLAAAAVFALLWPSIQDWRDRSDDTTVSAVELQIKREACADTMSGEEFAASAQLKVGDQSFSGCGRFLAE